MIRAVLLDALGTLVALEDPAPALVAQLRRRGVRISLEDARGAMQAEIAYYRAHHDEASSPAALADLRRRCAAVLAGALPRRAARMAPQELEAALLASLVFRPFPEVPGVLAALRASGTRAVVLSNWDVSLHDHLAATGLARLVDGAVTSAEIGAAKPDPAAFAAALAVAGVEPGDALMVGDDPVADVAGARAAGIAAVLVDRHGAGAPAGVEAIPTLADLPRLVGSRP